MRSRNNLTRKCMREALFTDSSATAFSVLSIVPGLDEMGIDSVLGNLSVAGKTHRKRDSISENNIL